MEALVWGLVDAFLSVVYILQVKKLWFQEPVHPKIRKVLWRLIVMCAICFGANVVNTTIAFAMTQRDMILAISVSNPTLLKPKNIHTNTVR
jgi:hypothetical protein